MKISEESLLQNTWNAPDVATTTTTTTTTTRISFLNKFKEICQNFYLNGDVVAGELIGLVEFADKSDDKVELNWEATGVLKTPTHILEERLLELGFLAGKMIYPEDWSLYMKEKNEIRSTWHTSNQLKTQREFNELVLHAEHKNLSMFERVRELRSFLNTWASVLGAAPFLKGLRRTIETQFGKNFLVTWTFLDDALTQAGPEFMRHSTRLLSSVLGFTQFVDLENTEQGESAGVLRVWQVNDSLGDIQLDRLLGLFPKERGLPGRMTGSIQIGSARRASDLVVKSTLLKYLIRCPGRLLLWLAQVLSDLQHAATHSSG